MSDDAVRDDRSSAKPQTRRGGRGLAVFATLIALAALGVAGYPYYQRIVGTGASESSGEMEALRAAQQRQADDIQRLIAGATAFDAQLKQQSGVAGQGIAVVSNDAAQTPNPLPERALRLAEAEFLLQSANDRLLVTRDVRAALAMLLAAQSLLDPLDDQSLAEARSALASEVASLRNVSGVDVGATYQRLQTLARSIPELPARGVRFTAAPTTVNVAADGATLPAPSAWTLAWQKFLSLFEFHRQGATVRPPLGPDEATYLRLNLGLMIQTAELALLRNDAAVYQQSLEAIRHWLDDYLDTGAQEVASVRNEIDQLLMVRLDRSMPDISGSLNALRRVLSGAPQAPSITPAEPSANP